MFRSFKGTSHAFSHAFYKRTKGVRKRKTTLSQAEALKKKITAKMPIIHSPLKTKKALTQQQMGTTGTRTHTHTQNIHTHRVKEDTKHI